MTHDTGESLAIAADDRFKALQAGLSQLPDEGLSRLHTHITTGAGLVLDEVHFYYDDATGNGLWCPLAIGLDVPSIAVAEGVDLSTLTEKRAAQLIRAVGRDVVSGFTLNPVSGLRGEFFTRNRSKDIAFVVGAMLEAPDR